MNRSEFLSLSVEDKFYYLLSNPESIRKFFAPTESDYTLYSFINEYLVIGDWYQYKEKFADPIGEIILSNYSESELIQFIERDSLFIYWLPKITVNILLKYKELNTGYSDKQMLFNLLSDDEKIEFYIRSEIPSKPANIMIHEIYDWMCSKNENASISDELAIIIIKDLIQNSTGKDAVTYINCNVADLLFSENRKDSFWRIVERIFPEGCLFYNNITSEVKNNIIDYEIKNHNNVNFEERCMLSLAYVGGYKLFYPLFDVENPADISKLKEFIKILSHHSIELIYGMMMFKDLSYLRRDIYESLIDVNIDTATYMKNIDEQLLLKIFEKNNSKCFIQQLDIDWESISDTTKLMIDIC